MVGVTSIFATCESGCGPNCAMRVTYLRSAYGLAGHNVSAVLHLAAISVLGTECGRWPTVIMHTVRYIDMFITHLIYSFKYSLVELTWNISRYSMVVI